MYTYNVDVKPNFIVWVFGEYQKTDFSHVPVQSYNNHRLDIEEIM